jgi:nickel transport protein
MRLPRPPVSVPLSLAAIALPAVGVIALFPSAPAHSHAIETSLERLAHLNAPALELESRFSTGEPASQARVRLLPPAGEAIELGQTDADGKLLFKLPRQARDDWELQVDAGPGHRDYLQLAEGISGPAPSPVPLALTRPQPRQWLNQRPYLLAGLAGGFTAAGLVAFYRQRP